MIYSNQVCLVPKNLFGKPKIRIMLPANVSGVYATTVACMHGFSYFRFECFACTAPRLVDYMHDGFACLCRNCGGICNRNPCNVISPSACQICIPSCSTARGDNSSKQHNL